MVMLNYILHKYIRILINFLIFYNFYILFYKRDNDIPKNKQYIASFSDVQDQNIVFNI